MIKTFIWTLSALSLIAKKQVAVPSGHTASRVPSSGAGEETAAAYQPCTFLVWTKWSIGASKLRKLLNRGYSFHAEVLLSDCNVHPKRSCKSEPKALSNSWVQPSWLGHRIWNNLQTNQLVEAQHKISTNYNSQTAQAQSWPRCHWTHRYAVTSSLASAAGTGCKEWWFTINDSSDHSGRRFPNGFVPK